MMMNQQQRPVSSESKNSLRCDSASSEEYLEISSSPEPLKLLNRYRELCRIFRVQKANSFLVKLLLRFSWAEIQTQLAVIRHNKLHRAKQAQLKEYKLQFQIEMQEREKQEKLAREQQRRGQTGGSSSSSKTGGGVGILSSNSNNTGGATAAATTASSAPMKKSVRIAEEGNTTTFFDDSHNPSSLNQNNNNEDGQQTHEQHHSLQELAQIIHDLDAEVSQSQILVYQPYNWRESLTTLDCSRTYLGPRGIIAVAALVSEMPWVTEFNLSNMAWFTCDERSKGVLPSGEEVLRVVCLLLSGHPCLENLILDGNDFATASYVWLVDFCKKNSAQMRLKKISLEDSFLEEFQKEHLQGILDRNEVRRDNYALTEMERTASGYNNNNNSNSPSGKQPPGKINNKNSDDRHFSAAANIKNLHTGNVGFAESFAVTNNNNKNAAATINQAAIEEARNAKDKMLQSHRKEKMEKSARENSNNNNNNTDETTTGDNNNSNNNDPSSQNDNNNNTPEYAPPAKVSHLPSGPQSHRRGWNHLLQFCTNHPDFIRWSVLVTRELCQTVFSSSDPSSPTAAMNQSVIPVSPSKEKQKRDQQQRLKQLADKSPLSHSPSSKTSKRITDEQLQGKTSSTSMSSSMMNKNVPVTSANAQSMIYLMSGGGPSVLPGLRDSLIQHPFTTENCRFQTTQGIQSVLETVFKCNPVLAMLDDKSKADVISRGRIVKRTSRSVIMETGDPCDFVYLVLHGGLEIRGKPQVLSASAANPSSPKSGVGEEGTNNNSASSSAKAAFLATSTLNPNYSTTAAAAGSVRAGREGVADGMQQYFASPSIFPAGSFVGGEEVIQPNITQNERRTATLVTTPCSVIPPVLGRRALIRQSISIDNQKAEQILSNLPLVEACYDNQKLLERANAELDYASEGSSSSNHQYSSTSAEMGMQRRSSGVSFGGYMSGIANNSEEVASSLRQVSETTVTTNHQQHRATSPSSAGDPHRGEKTVTIDDDEEGLELEAENHNTLRTERLKQLYGIRSLTALREIEKQVHHNRVYNSIEDEREIAAKNIEDRLNEGKNNTDDVEESNVNSNANTPTKRSSSSSFSPFKNDHDSVTVLFLVPRDVLVQKLLQSIRDQRKQWGSFLESLPALVSLPTHYKMCLADAMRRRQFTQGEIVGAGLALYDSIFVVIEGNATVYFQRSEIRRLNRGDIFACHPKTDVSRVSIVASGSVSGNTSVSSASAYLDKYSQNNRKKELSQLVIGTIAPTFAATLPVGLQRFLLKMRRVYSLAADPGVIQPDGS